MDAQPKNHPGYEHTFSYCNFGPAAKGTTIRHCNCGLKQWYRLGDWLTEEELNGHTRFQASDSNEKGSGST